MVSPPCSSRSPAANVQRHLAALGINPAIIADRGLPSYAEATALVVADVSQSGRQHLLIPEAAEAWQLLKTEALNEGVELIAISAFRSYDRQAEILHKLLDGGSTIESLLKRLAPPGCSEHHTGRAIDIGTRGCQPASIEFEQTDAYGWLALNAGSHHFSLSYPRDNTFGYAYEPWHWCYRSPS